MVVLARLVRGRVDGIWSTKIIYCVLFGFSLELVFYLALDLLLFCWIRFLFLTQSLLSTLHWSVEADLGRLFEVTHLGTLIKN